MAQKIILLNPELVHCSASPMSVSILVSRPPVGSCFVTNLYMRDGKLIVEYDDVPRTEENGGAG